MATAGGGTGVAIGAAVGGPVGATVGGLIGGLVHGSSPRFEGGPLASTVQGVVGNVSQGGAAASAQLQGLAQIIPNDKDSKAWRDVWQNLIPPAIPDRATWTVYDSLSRKYGLAEGNPPGSIAGGLDPSTVTPGPGALPDAVAKVTAPVAQATGISSQTLVLGALIVATGVVVYLVAHH